MKPMKADFMKTKVNTLEATAEKNDELTTCHVIARNSPNRTNRGGCCFNLVAHAHAGAIALRDVVDEEVGERSMSVGYLDSNGGQQHATKAGEMHEC